MKKLLALALTGAMLLSLAACGGGSEASSSAAEGTGSTAAAEGEATYADTLRVVIPQDPGTLEPGKINTQTFFQVVRQIYEPLFTFMPDGTLEPWLCESYEYEDDTNLIIHLREGVKFSDGTPLTAEDVLWSLKRIVDQSLPPIAYIIDIDFEKSEVIDDNTLRLVTVRPAATLTKRLAFPGLGVASKAAYENGTQNWLGDAVVGTGPYKLVEYVAGDRLELTANENYWREGEPATPNLVLRFVGDQTARSTEAKAKGADIVITLNHREFDAVEAVDGMHVETVPSTNSVYLMLNCKKAPLDDPKVREAFTYGINLQQTAELVYGDFGSAPSGMIAPIVFGNNPDSFAEYWAHGYDPEKAKEMLAEAGYPDGVDVEILVETGDTARNEMAQAFQAQLAPAGINLQITQLDAVVLYDRVNAQNQHDMVLSGLTCSDYEADNFLNQLLEGSTNIKMTNFDDPHFFELIETGATIMDDAEREKAWQAALDYLMEANVMIPVWHKDLNGAVADNVEGFNLSPAFEEHYYQFAKVRQ